MAILKAVEATWTVTDVCRDTRSAKRLITSRSIVVWRRPAINHQALSYLMLRLESLLFHYHSESVPLFRVAFEALDLAENTHDR